jgi:hypothetical protein
VRERERRRRLGERERGGGERERAKIFEKRKKDK